MIKDWGRKIASLRPAWAVQSYSLTHPQGWCWSLVPAVVLFCKTVEASGGTGSGNRTLKPGPCRDLVQGPFLRSRSLQRLPESTWGLKTICGTFENMNQRTILRPSLVVHAFNCSRQISMNHKPAYSPQQVQGQPGLQERDPTSTTANIILPLFW